MKRQDHVLTKTKNVFCVLASIIVAMEDKFIQNTLSNLSTETYLPSEGANFHLEVHDCYLKGNLLTTQTLRSYASC